MKIVKEQLGVVAVFEGCLWGKQYEDGYSTTYSFGPVENAEVSVSKYCKKSTDMTWKSGSPWQVNPYYGELEKSVLKKIKITTIYAVGD